MCISFQGGGPAANIQIFAKLTAHNIKYKLSFTFLIAVWMYECYIPCMEHSKYPWQCLVQNQWLVPKQCIPSSFTLEEFRTTPTCPQIGSSAVKKTDELTGFEVFISFLFTEICICDQYLVSCLFSYFLLFKVRSCLPVEISVSGLTPAYLQQLITNNWLPGDCVSFCGGG